MRGPPPSDTDATTVEFGIPVVDDHLSDANITYPATTEEILEAVDNVTIPYDAAGNTVQLKTALQRTEPSEFRSKNDVLDALYTEFESYRSSGTAGFIDTIRELLPI